MWGSVPCSADDLLWGTGQFALPHYSMPEIPVETVPKEVFPWKEQVAMLMSQ